MRMGENSSSTYSRTRSSTPCGRSSPTVFQNAGKHLLRIHQYIRLYGLPGPCQKAALAVQTTMRIQMTPPKNATDVPDFEVNGQPNAVGSYWEHDLIMQAQDAALDPTYGGWNRPPIGYVWDVYESESEEDEDAHEDDPTTREGSWDPTQEDLAFPSEYEEDDMEGADGDLDEAGAENDAENSVGEYEMDGEMDEEGDETTSGTVVVRQEDDIAGSDFDSDEELSGDEFVMGRTV
ncbi:hypothetical protein EV421DRAFT_484028 [Armillaria borealis]|uniref:Uncharacterized protein n=1 Tax=Armillaria borealis TaxID=47425 RepID=A0AA39JLM7_9AGAR|nr:hypothetical protein EV421DRAFT_484028 [Armillaria borealis]